MARGVERGISRRGAELIDAFARAYASLACDAVFARQSAEAEERLRLYIAELESSLAAVSQGSPK